MKIAISAEIEELRCNNIFKRDICRKYLGTEWMYHLNQIIKEDHLVSTCDVALENIELGVWDSKDIFVIQHMDDKIGRKLISLGSIPFIILSFESPLYQGQFYDKSQKFISMFKHKLLFDGLFNTLYHSDENEKQVRFPSFSLSENSFINKKKKINKIVFVFSNQYIHHKSINNLRSFNDVSWYFRKFITELRFGSSVSRSLSHSSYQLHDKRLELLTEFLDLNYIDLYGKNWDSYSNLPMKWRKALLALLGKPKNRSIPDKLNTISNYRFCLCMENFEYPGYITEKIIHSIVAQSVPIYLGAPNIEKHFPTECYIDVRRYKNVESMYDYIKNLDEDTYQKMIMAGQKFLKSNSGSLHSYEGFANNIADLINVEALND